VSDLRSELLRIRDEAGALTPALVVAAATPEGHPLHNRFTWDDTIAGHKYRIIEARELIRVVREQYVDRKGGPASTRFFVSVPAPTGMVYEPTAEVAQNEVGRQVVLRAMEREWRTLKRRYEQWDEFTAMVMRDLAGDAA